MEAEVWQEARRVAKTGEAKFVHYRMNEQGTGRQRHGLRAENVDVFLEPLLARHKELYETMGPS